MNPFQNRFNKRRNASTTGRRGATTVEMGIVLPVFLLFLSLIYEFGHAYLVLHTIQGAAKIAAREGAIEGTTNAQVTAKITDIVSGAFDPSKMTVRIKDASAYDDTDIDPSTITYSSLPNMDVANAEERQLFMVRVEVDYDDITIMPAFWQRIVGERFAAQSVMRHE